MIKSARALGAILLFQIAGWAVACAASAREQSPVAAGTKGPALANSSFGYPYPTAPDCDERRGSNGCPLDLWDMTQGQCTSWVAFREAQVEHRLFTRYGGRHWGNASNWGPIARRAGIPVIQDPIPGTIAWWRAGHVAFVEHVKSRNTIVISEMNYDNHNGFRVRTLTRGSRDWPTAFILVGVLDETA